VFKTHRPQDDPRWAFWVLIFLVLNLALARVTYADTGAPPASLPAVPPIVGLLAGDPAPNDGLLVPEETFKGFLHQKIDLEACGLRVAARDKAIADYLATPPPVAKGPDLGWKFTTGAAVGFVIGVLVTGALTYAAVKVVQATQ